MTRPKSQSPFESAGAEPAFPGRLYTHLASWWHLLTTPAEYADAAAFYWKLIQSACASAPRTILELGSGGGNTASFLKCHCRLTLVDISPQMLVQSQSINPECEHVAGDMRAIRLGRLFDAIFVQDAISYMLTEADLEQAIQSAFVHCRPGGVALFAPDYVRETFRSSTSHGGHDSDRGGMRYLEWTWDPDPDDSTYLVDFAYLLRDENGDLRVESDRLQLGVFRRADWLRIIESVGFEPRAIPFEQGELGPGSEVFLALKPNSPEHTGL
jgi:SAM-dependent methyltransferase